MVSTSPATRSGSTAASAAQRWHARYSAISRPGRPEFWIVQRDSRSLEHHHAIVDNPDDHHINIPATAATKRPSSSHQLHRSTLIMLASHLKNFAKPVLVASLLGAATAITPLQANAFTASDINPAFTFVSPTVGTHDLFVGGSSYGYFFDLSDNRTINALGFSAQDVWLTNPNPQNYTVQLWSYVTNPITFATTYTSLASYTFNPINPYILKDNFYWQDIPKITLPGTSSDPNTGYVIGAIGNFNSPNNFIETDDPNSMSSSVAFQAFVSNDGNGYNVSGFPEYPVPAFDGGIGTSGYWNANFSTEVPGPLPVFGALAAYQWSRKLRSRAKSIVNN